MNNTSEGHHVNRFNSLLIGLAPLAVLPTIVGCWWGTEPLEVHVRDLVSCELPGDWDQRGGCTHGSSRAGALSFRLYPSEGRVVVRVRVQDPKNHSTDVFSLDDCAIWDANNWVCTDQFLGGFTTREAQRGVFRYRHHGSYAETPATTGKLVPRWKQSLGLP